jgi:hypothetical protein
MLGMRRPNIAAISFDRHAFNVVAELLQLAGERFANPGFLSSGGFNVDKSTRERKDFHLSRIAYRTDSEPKAQVFNVANVPDRIRARN